SPHLLPDSGVVNYCEMLTYSRVRSAFSVIHALLSNKICGFLKQFTFLHYFEAFCALLSNKT
ncbi:MAG: hypothetical protein V2I56_19445, partial [Desulfobacteraceae bacterium]|nr:hypothetical protein [Desulfobacteraceae bacterium]